MNHAYPSDLALFLADHWDLIEPSDAEVAVHGDAACQELPPPPVLESLVSTCYQASLMREEQRTVTFRIIVCEPERFPQEAGPPSGLHRLTFNEPRPFSAHELRRLSPAANFHRSLIGVRLDEELGPQIWGIVNSGPRWLRSLHGGRGSAPPIPPCLVVSVSRPGHVEVSKGSVTVGQLGEGRIFGPSMDVFESHWLRDNFAPIRAERLALHKEARSHATTPWAKLDLDVTRIIDQHMMKRIIAAVRAFHHGGTLVMVPPERTEDLCARNPFIFLKYKFAEGEPRARFRTLIVNMMNTLAQIGGREVEHGSIKRVGWKDYEKSHDARLASLDEAIFEMSHLIAALTTVDGAVVLTKRFELLGFGGEILCEQTEVRQVARALDLEGDLIKTESTHGVGTRHRSAYRLCYDLREAMSIVISQDGGVRFVRFKDDHVTYWDHQATFTFSSRF